jgi:neutral ceramidase
MALAGPDRVLHAGVARVVITPPVGIRMCGYTVQEGVSRGIERELTATALVLSGLQSKVAILAVDILFIQSPHVERIRERIGKRLDIPSDHVLINTSHTHLGPTLPGWGQEAPEQAQLQQRYVEILEESLAGVASVAEEQMRPARLAAGKGSAPLGINRREKLPDGRVIIGENPQGAVDREVDVIRIDDLSGKPIATLMIAGCHTVVLGPRSTVLSPDFVGTARDIVEPATGCLSLFLQGAAGNINPACGIGSGGPEQFDDLKRMGAMLAGETLKVWAQLRTHHRRGPRRVVQSVAAISNWSYELLQPESLDFFCVAARRKPLAMAPLPDRATAEREVTKQRQVLEQARSQPEGVQNVARRLLERAELVLSHVLDGRPVVRELQVWAMRINDVGLVAVNGEPFAEMSLEVKRRSPLASTFFLGYSNGCLGYLPTPEAFAEGGMEVEESVRNYLLPAAFTPEWGPAVVDTSLELLRQLVG